MSIWHIITWTIIWITLFWGLALTIEWLERMSRL